MWFFDNVHINIFTFLEKRVAKHGTICFGDISSSSKTLKCGPKYHMWYSWGLFLTQPGDSLSLRQNLVVLIIMRYFKISFSPSQFSLFVVMLKLKLKLKKPTVSRAGTKELFTLILKILQITNLKTIKNHLTVGPFKKIDDYTN